MSEKLGDFLLHHVSNTYERTGSTLRTQVNWELKDNELWGSGFNTLTVEHDMKNPNATSGKCLWAGEVFLPDGTRAMGWDEGTWEATDEHTWKVEVTGWNSLDGNTRTEGVISLAERTFSGSVYKA